jgi:hypothetical protein
MKNLIIILLIAVLGLSSCVTEKMRAKICNNCSAKTVVKDSIYQVQCWDTVRLAPIAGPVIYLQNPCDSLGHLKPVLITKTKNGVKGTVNSLDNTIVFTCETDSLKAYIQTLKEKYVFNKKNESEVKYLPCKSERTKFDGFTFWWFWITLVALVAFFVIKILRTYLRAYLPFKVP